MSTHCLIAKQVGPDAYLTIYCHSDGYPKYTGALLLKHYNTPEKLNKLLALGGISILKEKVDPDPSRPHGFSQLERQEDVTVAYGRDRGDPDMEAQLLSLEGLLHHPFITHYVYVFDCQNQWKYFQRHHAMSYDANETWAGFCDLKANLEKILPSAPKLPNGVPAPAARCGLDRQIFDAAQSAPVPSGDASHKKPPQR